MKFISAGVHGILDYVFGLVLGFTPLFFSLDAGPEKWVPVITGWTIVVLAFFTRFRGGFIRVIPFNVHLVMDYMAGAILAASPWLFGFADRSFVPHFTAGLLEIVIALCTRRTFAT